MEGRHAEFVSKTPQGVPKETCRLWYQKLRTKPGGPLTAPERSILESPDLGPCCTGLALIGAVEPGRQ
jgi:hypothetical protein